MNEQRTIHEKKDSSQENRLIRLCQDGDVAALGRLYRRYSKDVYNMAMRMVGSVDIAEEITQDVFISVFKDIWRFQFQSSFTTWLYRIVLRRSADFFRKNKSYGIRKVELDNTNQGKPVLELNDPGPSPLDEAFESEKERLIEKAILSVSPKQRSILILRYVQNLSYEEIAEILKCRIGTVKSRLNRAHKSLETKLEEYNLL